jgi:hypothetical protein
MLILQVLSCECRAIVGCMQGNTMKAGDIRNQHVHSHILSLELLVDFDKVWYLVHFIILSIHLIEAFVVTEFIEVFVGRQAHQIVTFSKI